MKLELIWCFQDTTISMSVQSYMQMVQTLNHRLTVTEQPISQAILEITTDADLISKVTNRDPEKVAYVDVRPIGLGFSNISISPSEIRVTSRGYDNEGNLVTGDDNALVTNKPRTPNLAAWNYPSVPQDVNEMTIKDVSVSGIAKEGQALNASLTPSSATAAFKWESSNGWHDVENH